MHFSLRTLQRLILAVILTVAGMPAQPLQAAIGTKAMVVTADPHATRAAIEVLEAGGNAVDAAIAAQWVLNVVEPASSGIGGGGFFLYYEADTKRLYAFDGRESAPAEAFPAMFLDKDGKPLPFKPDAATGGLPVGVPGTLKLLHTVHGRFSSKQFSFAQLFDPAIELAEKGFPISERLASFIVQEKDRLKLFPDSKRIFLDEKENPRPAGTILFQPDLGQTFRLIQKEGINVFYEGALAEDIVKAVRESPYHPGKMKKSDLFYYRIFERDPVRGSYRDYDIFSMGPPSSGGSTLIEALQILERYQLHLYEGQPEGWHLFMEAQKLAFRDRNEYLADPAFSKIPLDKILSKEFAYKRSEEMSFQAALPSIQAAARPLVLEEPHSHTSHISIVDEHGNMVSYTTTIEEIFGSCLMVPGRGFFLNNELTDFDMDPKNAKGELLPNAPEGDKRPRSSMTPTFIFKDGKPFMIIGSPGGSKIIGAVLNVVVNVIDYQLPLREALGLSRAINRDGPVEMESALFHQDLRLKRELERRGHPVVESGPIGNVQAILFDTESELLTGESDPRGEGEAMGY